MGELENIPPGVDPTKPSAGRLYDHYLGGTEYLEVDRIAADRIRAKVPELEDIVWSNRGFLQRASRWLAAEPGIRQFIDIGAGLPTRNNTHEAAQSVAPDARTVYVDNDPMILAHARSLLVGTKHTAFITGDLRQPEGILENPELRELIDLEQPTALVLAAITHFISDEQDPWGLVAGYMKALAPGSYLVLSHITNDKVSPEGVQAFVDVYKNASEELFFRSRAEIERFFDGIELVPPYPGAEPRVSFTGVWGSENPEEADSEGSRWGLCGVARKP